MTTPQAPPPTAPDPPPPQFEFAAFSVNVFAGYRPGRDAPLWAVELAEDALAASTRELNLNHLAMARACLPAPDTDLERHLSTLTARTGIPRHRVSTYCDIGFMLTRFHAVASRLAHGAFSLGHLTMLTRALEGVDDERLPAVQESLLRALVPRRSGEALPGVRALHNKVQKIIADCDPLARPLDQGEQASTRPLDKRPTEERRVYSQSFPDSSVTTLTAVLTDVEAEEFTTILDAVCRKLSCSRADGLMHLARGTADVSVTLNLFRDPDSPIAATENGTWLDALATEDFMERVSALRVIGHGATERYTPTEAIAAFVRGRDGTCRFPGCDVPALICDLDHVMRFLPDNAGGPTSTENLHCLCRKHHVMKTMGWFDVTLSGDGAEMWTSIDDGHIYMTEPSGPLATYARSTLRIRSDRRRATLREHNRLRLESLDELAQALSDARHGEVPF
jgi:hypothetical protein